MPTLQSLAAALANLDTKPLVFRADGTEIGAGFHVTELKSAALHGIDCGGRQSSWQETHIQLLDGSGTSHMPVGKFHAILRKSVAALPQLGEAALFVEYAPANQGLGRYRIAGISDEGARVLVDLAPDRAVCKPAKTFAGTGCCGRS